MKETAETGVSELEDKENTFDEETEKLVKSHKDTIKMMQDAACEESKRNFIKLEKEICINRKLSNELQYCEHEIKCKNEMIQQLQGNREKLGDCEEEYREYIKQLENDVQKTRKERNMLAKKLKECIDEDIFSTVNLLPCELDDI